MTLTQQFLLILILPAILIALALYSATAGLHRPRVRTTWILSLLTSAVWASSLLSFYAGATFPIAASYTWGVVGNYALTLLPIFLLLTTARYVLVPQADTRAAVWISTALWLSAMVADPRLGLAGPWLTGRLGGLAQAFYFWSAIWVAGWLVAFLAALLIARHAYKQTPGAVYRNQLAYWQLTLALFAGGSGIALIQPAAAPVTQEVGAIFLLAAAGTGTLQLVRAQLPDLRVALRRLAGLLAAGATIFTLATVALLVLVSWPGTQPGMVTLPLLLAAAGFTALFMVAYAVVGQLGGEFASRSAATSGTGLNQSVDDLESLESPARFGRALLSFVGNHLDVPTARLYMLQPTTHATVRLMPVAALGNNPGAPLTVAENNPFLLQLQAVAAPLAQYDVDSLVSFLAMSPVERQALAAQGHELYVPLHAGATLIGVLALGQKRSEKPFGNSELDWLQEIGEPAALLLAQARQLAALHLDLAGHREETLSLLREKQQLEALNHLYAQCATLVSPDLGESARALNYYLADKPAVNENGANSEVVKHAAALRTPLESLAAIIANVRNVGSFAYEPVHVDTVVRQVQYKLANMAVACRVEVSAEVPAHLPTVQGNEERLVEALQHVVHNAIKFNRIGGKVRITADTAPSGLCIAVSDTGVGIPAERIAQIWDAYRDSGSDPYGSQRPSIGLLLARYQVEAHGGQIEVESHYGTGSTFRIYLPLGTTELKELSAAQTS